MKTSDISEPLFLAADSGGSKTIWRYINAQGKTVKQILTPGMASLHSGMLPVAEYASTARNAMPDAAIKHIYISLGGPNTQEITQTLQKIWQDSIITVEREASGDLAASCMAIRHYNAVVMAGTGVTAMGFNADGSRNFAEGWGPVAGDFGSGGHIGLTAMQTFLRGVDKTAKSGRLPELFTEMLAGLDTKNFSDRMELKKRINSLDRRALAALVPQIMQFAAEGDEVSLDIISKSAEYMAQTAAAVAPEGGTILMLGGLFDSGEFYRDLCQQKLQELRSDCCWIRDKKCSIINMAGAKVLLLNNINLTSNIWENITNE